MAKMLVSPANFLLLDEPTNHLDLRAKDVLLEAIRDFSGTVLFVSHDRYFIDGLATRVFEVEDRRVHIYPGNYEDYLFRKQGGIPTNTAEAQKMLTHDATTNAKVDAATGMFKVVAASKAAKIEDVGTMSSPQAIEGSLGEVTAAPKSNVKRLNPIKLKQLEDRVTAIEEELPDLEARIQAAEQQQGFFTTAEAAQAGGGRVGCSARTTCGEDGGVGGSGNAARRAEHRMSGPASGGAYSATPLVRKLGLITAKGGAGEVAVLGEPEGFRGLLGELPESVKLHARLRATTVLALCFVHSRAELASLTELLGAQLPRAAHVWVLHPKAQRKPDFNQNDVRDAGTGGGAGGLQGLFGRRELVGAEVCVAQGVEPGQQ